MRKPSRLSKLIERARKRFKLSDSYFEFTYEYDYKYRYNYKYTYNYKYHYK